MRLGQSIRQILHASYANVPASEAVYPVDNDMRYKVWFPAGLLALVVAKLFIVDLAGTGTIGRIVSFLVVGLLMLLIGYISPLPPRKEVAA